jgi:hypothetical protein
MATQATYRKRLDARIAQVESKLADLKALRKTFDRPGVTEELALVFEPEAQSKRAENDDGLRRTANYDKIERFFRKRDNAPATREEVISGTGLTRSSATQTMYVSHKVLFVRQKPRPKDGQRFTLFRLKQPTAG